MPTKGLLLLIATSVAVVAAVAPKGASVIREQQQQQQEVPAGEWQANGHRRSGLSAASASMSCPSQPQADGQQKAEWPELQGKTVDEAKAVLQQEAPGFRIQVIGPGMMATMEWRCDRIRLWLNDDKLVSQIPRIG